MHRAKWKIATRLTSSVLLISFAASPALAKEECAFTPLATFLVTFDHGRPIANVKINDKPVRLFLDSRSFWSSLAEKDVAQLGITPAKAPDRFSRRRATDNRLVTAMVAKARLTLGDQTIPDIDFFVVPGFGEKSNGSLAQNLLRLGDVEYDLVHGAVRMWRSKGCANTNIAYWANDLPLSQVPIEPTELFEPRIITSVKVNGFTMRALLDTTEASSYLTGPGMRKVGITSESEGVVSRVQIIDRGGNARGSWVAPFESFEIGGLLVKKPRLRFVDVKGPFSDKYGNYDMVLGSDLLLATRMLVATSKNEIYFTYNGGALFDVSDKNAPTSGADEPMGHDALALAAESSALLARGETGTALVAINKALAEAPANSDFMMTRASILAVNEDIAGALRDLDAAVKIDPKNAEIRLARAKMRLEQGDRAGAKIDVDSAATGSQALANAVFIARIYTELNAFDLAIIHFSRWLDANPESGSRHNWLNERCWTRALAGKELDAALADCNRAIALRPDIGAFDSRGLVYLRKGDYAAAIKDYDMVLKNGRKLPWSLYGRGVEGFRAPAGVRKSHMYDPRSRRRCLWRFRLGVQLGQR